MNKNSALILGAAAIGIVSVPVAAMVNIVVGLIMMTVPMFMVYRVK